MRLVVAVSVLVPFLAVYVSHGLLQQDLYRFTNEAAYAEFNQFSLEGSEEYDFAGRLAIYDWQVVVAIVVIAWVLRFGLGKLESVTRFLALAFVGALVEVYYTSQLAQKVSDLRAASIAWVENRRASQVAVEQYDRRARAARQPRGCRHGLALRVDRRGGAGVVVPLAWLTVGAVVLGHRLSPPERAAGEPNPHLQRIPAPVRQGRIESIATKRVDVQ